VETKSEGRTEFGAGVTMKIEGKIVHGYLKALSGLEQLPGPNGERSVELFRHGTLTVKLYAPRSADHQHPHTRDEIYVIATGTGRFEREGKEVSFGPGDVLFVAAGEQHRFIEFTDDFATWVFFYGPEGGEANREKS
jgi:mannose-6-phosphate isomerase-like protein (cupin superfamily)